MLFFEIQGDPTSKLRPRTSIMRSKKTKKLFTHFRNSTKTIKAQGVLEAGMKDQLPLNHEKIDYAVSLDIICFMPKPKSLTKKLFDFGWMCKKPDYDNLSKLVADAATKAGVWKDDNIVSRESIIKVYDDEPRTQIYITRLKPLRRMQGCDMEERVLSNLQSWI